MRNTIDETSSPFLTEAAIEKRLTFLDLIYKRPFIRIIEIYHLLFILLQISLLQKCIKKNFKPEYMYIIVDLKKNLWQFFIPAAACDDRDWIPSFHRTILHSRIHTSSLEDSISRAYVRACVRSWFRQTSKKTSEISCKNIPRTSFPTNSI